MLTSECHACCSCTRSQLKAKEAAKHSEAAGKYLYKAAVTLLERQAWLQLAAVCGAMLAAADGDAAAQCSAVQKAGRLAGHAPEEHGAALLAAVAVQAGSAEELSRSACLELLGLLSSAAQRATVAATCGHLRQAAAACAASSEPLLQAAALLLPALALQAPSKGTAAVADWVEPVSAAVSRVASSIEQLEEQQAAVQPPRLDAQQQQHLAVLEASFLPANALRRMLGSSDRAGGSGSPAYASATAADAAASVLELLAGAVGVASRLAGPSSSLSSQGHAAAVGLVAAARLRAAAGCTAQPVCSSQAARWLLGWDLQQSRWEAQPLQVLLVPCAESLPPFL